VLSLAEVVGSNHQACMKVVIAVSHYLIPVLLNSDDADYF